MAKPLQEDQSLNASIDALARTYGPPLKRFFERRIIERADIDDLVQEVFLRLARRGDLKDIENLDGYIFQTAANILRDRLRQRFSRQASDHQPIDDEYIEDAAFSPERVLLGKEAVDRLSAALQKLPGRTGTVFLLCRLEGLPHAGVARKLGISVSSVDKHMAKALDFLMEQMKDELQ